ncbi:hypothetical protein C8F01DRAFT_1330000 [Mycena amicta]|nr:hypothetical protein C8F01DRAFT_1330000 [Mycena amicta]
MFTIVDIVSRVCLESDFGYSSELEAVAELCATCLAKFILFRDRLQALTFPFDLVQTFRHVLRNFTLSHDSDTYQKLTIIVEFVRRVPDARYADFLEEFRDVAVGDWVEDEGRSSWESDNLSWLNLVSEHPDTDPHNVPTGPIDFATAGLPEYSHYYAIVLDSLFSKHEVTAVLAAAEGFSPWDVAQINRAETAITNISYRNGQRIIYDSAELSQSIFDKVRPELKDIEEIEEVGYADGLKVLQKWRMVGLNERLRFLRYPVGGFFKKHMDGHYENEETGQRTFYTLQFYLPSDSSGSDDSFRPAKGGSTRFIGRKGAYADVQAIPGRVLVFRHSLLHTGEEVTDGVKCAVRSDILYEKVGEPVPFKK